MLAGKWGWVLWATTSFVAALALGGLMLIPDRLENPAIDRSVFLPGTTTDGHYQIELDCDACHTERFADRSSMQSACTECHSMELTRVDDSHPRTKFTDPRNADRVAVLDARWCVTCHQEHRPEVTTTMGLSLPTDYCYRCHEDIGEDRPTHADLPFDSCSNVGCHNFHDNRALYEDFLVDHREEPAFKPLARVANRSLGALAAARGWGSGEPLSRGDHDAPAELSDLEGWVDDWAGTAHAAAGVNCSDCHAPGRSEWAQSPTFGSCATCHEAEHEGFRASRHGMRLAAGLSPMTPELARLPMDPSASERILDCNQCHSAHAFDTKHAAADACLECHVDDHTLAWETSPHGRAWRQELDGTLPAGAGVSCATCHLPRKPDPSTPLFTRVDHNQNDYLRPRDKMIRSSCMECHGLAFSIDSLADPALVVTNFRGRPTRKVESIDYATRLRWKLEGRTPPWAGEEEDKNE